MTLWIQTYLLWTLTHLMILFEILKSILTITILFYPSPGKTERDSSKNERGSEFRRRRTRDRAGASLRRASWMPSWWDGRSSRPRRRSDERDDDGQSQEGQRSPPRLHLALRYAYLTDESETFRPRGRLGDRTPAASARRAEGQNRCRVARARTPWSKKFKYNQTTSMTCTNFSIGCMIIMPSIAIPGLKTSAAA